MAQLVRELGNELSARGLRSNVVQTALATLVDNALTHGASGAPPVAAVSVAAGRAVVWSRDRGAGFASCGDAREELRRRIQLPAEDEVPLPGAPAGIPWLARLIARRCPEGSLEFMAGDGRLVYSNGVWTCTRDECVEAFVAVARLPLS